MKKVVLFIITLFLTSTASAAIWNVTEVLSGNDGGFGYSSLHDASGSSVMSGSILGNILPSASGTYNDVTGAVDFTFTIYPTNGSASETLHLAGNLIFDSAGWLASNSTLTGTNQTVPGGLGDTTFGYKSGTVCCSGADFAPNSFMNSGLANLNYMTLWGADGFNTATGTYSNSFVGMDFRVGLSVSEVPVPAALFLFAPALLGFFGLRRKVTATA